MKLAYYNDGKQKYQSCEISLKEDDNFYNTKFNLFSHDISDIIGYGATKEEALEDFKRKFDYLMREYKALENLISTDLIDVVEK